MSKTINIAVALGVLITALGTVGLPLVIAIFTVGALLIGFVFTSLLNWLSQWFFPLIFAGTGIITMIVLSTKGTKLALAGIATLVGLLVLSYLLITGTFSGPTNTWNLLMSVGSKSSSNTVVLGPTIEIAIVAIVAGILDFVVAVYCIERVRSK